MRSGHSINRFVFRKVEVDHTRLLFNPIRATPIRILRSEFEFSVDMSIPGLLVVLCSHDGGDFKEPHTVDDMKRTPLQDNQFWLRIDPVEVLVAVADERCFKLQS